MLAAAVIWRFGFVGGHTPVNLLSAPVFVSDVDGGRVYLLTGQWRTIATPGGRSNNRRVYTDLFVDLWAIHARNAMPLWRKRLQIERGGAMDGRSLLGVDGDTVWILLQGNLVALSASDGTVLARAGQVEDLNPELKGLMPTEDRYFVFNRRGLHITAADARMWHVDPRTFKVSVDTDPTTPLEGVFPPEYISPGASGMHLVRGLDVPDHWLGLLTEAEAKTFEENNNIGGLTPETRRRLWGAKAVKANNFFGEYLDYTELAPLPESPEFLDGGLLREYVVGQQLPPLWARDPDSVFVLYRERLGETGTLHLARVAGPKGNVLWDAPLPLTIIQSVKRMDNTLVIFGREYRDGDPDIRDTVRDSPQRLVAVDIATGSVHTHNHGAIDTHPEAEPVALGL